MIQGVNSRYSRFWLCLFASFFLFSGVPSFFQLPSAQLQAEEPAERFLEELKRNGHFDLALYYLERLEQGPLVSDEFKKQIPFAKAELLIDSVARSRNLSDWEAKLNKAEQLLREYATNVSDAGAVAKTRMISGNLFRQRAIFYSRKSNSELLTADEKSQFTEKAREMLRNASSAYGDARARLRNYIQDYTVDPTDPQSEARLRTARTRYVRVRYNLPVVKEQLAGIFGVETEAGKRLLGEAVEEYKDVSDDYRRYRAGLDAGLGAARCEYKLNRLTEALFILEQYFEMESTDMTRDLKRQALLLGVQCWQRQKPFPFQTVIAVAEPSVLRLSKQELRLPEWLKVQLVLAKAYRDKAEFVGQEKKPGVGAQVRALNRVAVKMGKAVARTRTAEGEEARKLLAEWNLKVAETDPNEKELETFLDIRIKGQDVIADIELNLQEIVDLKKKNDEAGLEDAQARLNSQIDEALGYFDLALQKADGVERVELNRVRYYQSFCHFAAGRYFRSIVIGEFLMSKYPEIDWTRQSAGLSLRSYAQLLARAGSDEGGFESKRLPALAKRVLDRFPGSKEADLAARMAIITALNDGDVDSAETYFAKVGPKAASRRSLASRLGRRLWYDYLKLKAEGTVDKSIVPRAKKYLELAVDNIQAAEINFDMAKTALNLVDARLESGEVDAAASLLEKENIGPLDIVKTDPDSIANQAGYELFEKDAFTIAIKTYLAQIKAGKDLQNAVRRASGVIAGLQAGAKKSGSPGDQARLNRIYRVVATELKSNFDAPSDANSRKMFAKTIASFLGSIEENADDGPTVLWAGSTLLSMADSLTKQKMAADAKPIFRQAVSALNRAEKIGFGNAKNAKGLKDELKRQRALAERGSGNYEKSIEQFVEILTASPNRLGVQIDAALTYQMWGKAANNSQHYAKAMMGANKAKTQGGRARNVVWGWRRLYTVLRGKEKYVNEFYQSLYHLAESRFEYGVLVKNKKAVLSAKKEIENARKRDPKLGGPNWKRKLNQLEKRIEDESR